MAFPEGNKLFVGDIRANLDEKNTDRFNLQRDGTGNGLFNIKGTFVESLLLQTSVMHKRMCIFKAGLSSSYYDCWEKYKEKYRICQIPINMLKQHAIPNSSLHKLKIYS